jgi:pimeloyl-ACP methyl ester carboxylesterase
MPSGFKLLERGFTHAAVLVPGWATDFRIFQGLDLNYNYLLPENVSPSDFRQELMDALERMRIGQVSFFGWSQGGFLAAEFADKYPEKVREVTLLGIRTRYNPEALQDVAGKLKKNKRAYLYKFYRECFADSDREPWQWFKENLLHDYLDNLNLENLLSGLDYFSRVRLDPGALAKVEKVRIFHGEDDRIAPLSEAIEIKAQLAQAELVVLPGTGHAAFLSRKFREKFNHG